MHDSVMDFIRQNIHREDIIDKEVLEIGSRDVNGSPRTIIEPMHPQEYIGCDIEDCNGVDIVGDAVNLLKYHFHPDTFDIILCTEMLEHAKKWKEVVNVIKKLLKPGGILLLTTRSPGMPRHDHPDDHWRFTHTDILHIFDDMRIGKVEDDPTIPGVFILAYKPPDIEIRDLGDYDVIGVE